MHTGAQQAARYGADSAPISAARGALRNIVGTLNKPSLYSLNLKKNLYIYILVYILVYITYTYLLMSSTRLSESIRPSPTKNLYCLPYSRTHVQC